ncbi:MAG: nucleotide disphospho-sugar-binding domain-containing protein [Acidobacteriota bacterium]
MRLFLNVSALLRRHGHRITFFGISDNRGMVEDAGFAFRVIEPDHLPLGTLGRMMADMSALGNFRSMQLQGRFDELRYDCLLKNGPRLVEQDGVDMMIVDQAEACGGSIAEAARLPWVSVCNGLCLNSEPSVPPFFSSWGYSDSSWAVARNRLAYAALGLATRPIQRLINRHRKRLGLPPLHSLDETFSPYAQICQQNAEFDFPRQALPLSFHYVGPLHLPRGNAIEFPWNRLDGRPLVYGSLGTVVNRHRHVYRVIAEACADLEAQLVLSLGGSGNPEEYTGLPGNPLVVRYAPQTDLLRRASLTVTHAGLNTTLESLAAGVPLVAIPITFEQPAVASRIRWTGTGEFLRLGRATPARLRSQIRTVLGERKYRDAAHNMSQAISRSPGIARAAEIIEQIAQTRQPVYRTP